MNPEDKILLSNAYMRKAMMKSIDKHHNIYICLLISVLLLTACGNPSSDDDRNISTDESISNDLNTDEESNSEIATVQNKESDYPCQDINLPYLGENIEDIANETGDTFYNESGINSHYAFGIKKNSTDKIYLDYNDSSFWYVDNEGKVVAYIAFRSDPTRKIERELTTKFHGDSDIIPKTVKSSLGIVCYWKCNNGYLILTTYKNHSDEYDLANGLMTTAFTTDIDHIYDYSYTVYDDAGNTIVSVETDVPQIEDASQSQIDSNIDGANIKSADENTSTASSDIHDYVDCGEIIQYSELTPDGDFGDVELTTVFEDDNVTLYSDGEFYYMLDYVNNMITIAYIEVAENSNVTSEQVTSQGYSEEELCELAKEYYAKQYGQFPPCVEIDSVDGDMVNIHLYESGSDHDATWDWYCVSKTTGKGTDILGNEIDLSTVR